MISSILVLSSFLTLAHDSGKGWPYPPECCSDGDCWQVGERGEPDPVKVLDGWLLWDGKVVPYNKVRLSPDGNFHVCRWGASVDGDVVVPYDGKGWCLWVPMET